MQLNNIIQNESLEKIDDFYLTQNAYDVIRFIKGRKQDTRIVYDSNINYYFFSLAMSYTHLDLLEEAKKTGLYTEKDMIDYFLDNESSIYFLYYYNKDYQKDNKGFVSEQYPEEYNYNFGTICSYYTSNFEEMELYNILKNDLNEQLAYHGKTMQVWHGTNNKFDKFDLQYFSRGDYGYGIYFTFNKALAKDYGKYLVRAEIPNSEYFLDFELPVRAQGKYIEQCFDKLVDKFEVDEIQDRVCDIWNDGQNGQALYNLIWDLCDGEKAGAKLLYECGFKGTYSFNGDCYVCFSAKDIKIIDTLQENLFEKLNSKILIFI